jgi:hypothetical protein
MTSGTMQSDSQNFVANEIPNTQVFMGNYLLTGSGHFEYGNNVRGTITPPGPTTLADSSLYLDGPPSFWQSSVFPSIGMPNILSSGSISARDRYLSGVNLTVCDENILIAVDEPKKIQAVLFPNPASSMLNIRLNGYERGGLLLLKSMKGELIVSKTFTEKEVQMRIPETIPSGIYFLEIRMNNKMTVKKIIVSGRE